MLELKALDTFAFAQSQRPHPTCGARWDQLRCTQEELSSLSWSLHNNRELVRMVVQRAAATGTGRWSREQYRVLSDFIVDWELDQGSGRPQPEHLPHRIV